MNTLTGSSKIHRVNGDPFNDGFDHFFPWATTKADGSVYVGWYDDRNDPFNTKVEYFVGIRPMVGKTSQSRRLLVIPHLIPASASPGVASSEDYTQIASGPDGVVHAAWSDTRDGASMQIFSQAVTF